MKKSLLTIALVLTALLGTQTANAQDDGDRREARRQEMQARLMANLEKEMKLEDAKKAKFEEIYGRYQKDLQAIRGNRQEQGEQARNREKKAKDLTDAEATTRLQEVFARQEEQVQQSQARLDVQKKYCAEFSAVLTPQQLVILFQPAQQQGRGGNRQGGRGGNGGGQRGGFGGPGGGFGGPGGGGGFGGDF